MAFKADQFVRFVVTGGICAAVYLLVLSSLTGQLNLEVAATVSYAIATAVNYTLQKFWTFKSQRLHREAIPRFLMTHAGGILINAGLLKVLVEMNELPLLPSQFFVFGVLAVWTFILLRVWVFYGHAK